MESQTSTSFASEGLEPQQVLGRDRMSVARDLLELTKPNIVVMCLVMTVAGMWLAPGNIAWGTIFWSLLGTALAIGSANALNMLLERDVDARMSRTKRRPLPDGRLSPRLALVFGLLLGATSIVVLWVLVNPVTALLAALALDTYVLLYTPLKQRTHHAMLIGTIPGAVPPLLGWTAVTGVVEIPGLVLFAILALWQIPHYLAISVYRKEDYSRGGIRAVPVVKGEQAARRQALVAAALLIPVSLALIPLGIAGPVYGVIVSLAGAWFFWSGLQRFSARRGLKGARQFFFASLIYLPVFGMALMLNMVVR
jgi:protoheme IX farnesyltransferase